jgi:hypothetical protein
MPLHRRLLISLVIGFVCGTLTCANLSVSGQEAGDFSWALRGAHRLLEGQNPYNDPTLSPDRPYPYHDQLYYPLPALLLVLPFTILPNELAAGVFFGLSSGLLAWGILKTGAQRLIVFLSAPFWLAAMIAQWSPLLTATYLLPALLPLALCKPNLGILSIRNARWNTIWLCVALLAASLIVLPSWPLDWLENIRTGNGMHHPTMLTLPFGPLLLLLVLKWREERARLLLLLSLIPLFPVFYDHVPVFLVVRSWREGLFLALISWVGFFLWRFVPGAYAWTSVVFIGALLVVFDVELRRFFNQICLPLFRLFLGRAASQK